MGGIYRKGRLYRANSLATAVLTALLVPESALAWTVNVECEKDPSGGDRANNGTCTADVDGLQSWFTVWTAQPAVPDDVVKLTVVNGNQDEVEYACKDQDLISITPAYITARVNGSMSDSDGVLCYPPSPSPILLDLDRNQFHLSPGPILFDFNGDGIKERTAWTSENSTDGFLYFDRDDNGQLDNGTELFGNSTPLMSGLSAANGFLALAEFDQTEFGGNGDGIINPLDSVYAALRVWIDENADAQFEQVESFWLSDLGIAAIDLSYKEYPRVDEHGNVLRYNGTAWLEEDGKLKRIAITDVIFRTQDE
jgi:hypothetical protein